MRLSRFEEACGILSAAIEEFPANGEMHALLGWCRIQREERVEALENFRKALRLTPRKGKALHGMTIGCSADSDCNVPQLSVVR